MEWLVGMVALGALALCAYLVRTGQQERLAAADQLKALSFASQQHMLDLAAAAYDRLGAKSLEEVAQLERARELGKVQVKTLQDALASRAAEEAAPKRKIKALNGQEYDPSELESM